MDWTIFLWFVGLEIGLGVGYALCYGHQWIGECRVMALSFFNSLGRS